MMPAALTSASRPPNASIAAPTMRDGGAVGRDVDRHRASVTGSPGHLGRDDLQRLRVTSYEQEPRPRVRKAAYHRPSDAARRAGHYRSHGDRS